MMLLPARLHELQTISSLPKGFSGENTTAEIEIDPSGKFLFASNRGDDSIAVFAIDSHTGMLTHVETDSTGGKTPRNFAIDPTGSWLLAANQDSDNIVVFRIDQKTGHLTPTGDPLQVTITSLFEVCSASIAFSSRPLHRAMRADPPRITASTSESVAMLVSPGVVIASAPWATPH